MPDAAETTKLPSRIHQDVKGRDSGIARVSKQTYERPNKPWAREACQEQRHRGLTDGKSKEATEQQRRTSTRYVVRTENRQGHNSGNMSHEGVLTTQTSHTVNDETTNQEKCDDPAL